jgi:predicted small secreted protein
MMKRIALIAALCSAASVLVAGCGAQETGMQADEEVSESAAALSTTIPAVQLDKTRFTLSYIKTGNITFEPAIPFYPGSPMVTFNLPCDFQEIGFGAIVKYNDSGPTLYVRETYTVYDISNNILLRHSGLVTHLDAHTEADFGQPMFFGTAGAYPTTLIPLDSLVRVQVQLETFLDDQFTTSSLSPREVTDFWMRRNCSCSN